MRQHETPFEQLPAVAPRRLLLALLAFLRTSLPTQFRFITNLTRVAMQNQLLPFMWLRRHPILGGRAEGRLGGGQAGMGGGQGKQGRGRCKQPLSEHRTCAADPAPPTLTHRSLPTSMLAVEYPAALPLRYRLSLRGQPPAVPWAAPRSGGGGGGLALLVVKAALAARFYCENEAQCGYWIAEHTLHALSDATAAETVQVSRPLWRRMWAGVLVSTAASMSSSSGSSGGTGTA